MEQERGEAPASEPSRHPLLRWWSREMRTAHEVEDQASCASRSSAIAAMLEGRRWST